MLTLHYCCYNLFYNAVLWQCVNWRFKDSLLYVPSLIVSVGILWGLGNYKFQLQPNPFRSAQPST